MELYQPVDTRPGGDQFSFVRENFHLVKEFEYDGTQCPEILHWTEKFRQGILGSPVVVYTSQASPSSSMM